MVFSIIVLSAAFDAGGAFFKRLHSGEDGFTFRAGIEKPAGDTAAFEGKFMATRLVGNPEITACLAPLWTMGVDTATSGPMLGKKVGKFMAQCSLDLGGGNLKKLGIKNDNAITPNRHACSRA